MNGILQEAIILKTTRLMEAVIKDPELGEKAWKEQFLEKAKGNILIKRVMKEYVTSDVAYALGIIHDIAIEAAKKIAAGRELIRMVPVTQPLVRFYKAKSGFAWRINEGPPIQTPEHFETVDISVTHENGYDALFSQSYLEDIPFNVVERAIQDSAQLLEEQLTSDIVGLYENISATNLAGKAEISAGTADKLTWTDLVSAWTTLKKTGYHADVAMVHPDQIADLWTDDKFINSFYFGNLIDVQKGVLGKTYLGFKIVETNLCTPTKAHLIDTSKAAACLIRRDTLIQPYMERLCEGIISTIRYGLGTIREDAVARIVNA